MTDAHRIQISQRLDARLNHLLDLAQLADIRNRHAGLSSHALDLLRDFFAAGLVGFYVVDADIVPVLGEPDSDRLADATA